MSGLDPSLRAFVETSAAEDAERLLAALIEDEAAPLIRRIAARKLGAFGGAEGDDLEDIVGDAVLALVSRLQRLRDQPEGEPIERFTDYAAVVAHNTFAHYLRRRHPDRSRLKHRLRYVLQRDRRFALWRTAEGMVCGLASRKADSPSPEAASKLEQLVAEPDRWLPFAAGRDWGRQDEAELLGPVLKAVGGPVEFDRLVGAIAALSGLRRPQAVDPDSLAVLADETTPRADRALDERYRAQRAWQEIVRLPPRQRVALLLNLRDAHGACMLWVLPLIGTATLRQIAGVLEMPDMELAEMWERLPLDDRAIAERLGCTRQQVINLRAAARKRLGNRLGEGTPGESSTEANTPAPLASLGDER